MKVFLIEDDEFKQNDIIEELRKTKISFEFVVEKSVQGSIKNLSENDYDLILLDMALPSHNLIQGKGAPVPMPSGGMEVVMELAHEERVEKVIILTQFPEIEIEGKLHDLPSAKKVIIEEFGIQLLSVIRFRRQQNEWKVSLINVMNESFE